MWEEPEYEDGSNEGLQADAAWYAFEDGTICVGCDGEEGGGEYQLGC